MLRLSCVSALCGAVLMLAGCGSPDNTGPSAKTKTQAKGPQTDSKIEAALAKLSAEDREAATKQKTCPVSGEPLGSMGVPKKVKVKDREVFICCAACEKPLLDDPDKYLAKLDK